MLDFIISAISQVSATFIIAYGCYRVSKIFSTYRGPFFEWIGLIKVPLKNLRHAAPLILLFVVMVLAFDWLFLKYSPVHQAFARSDVSPFGRLWQLGFNFEGIVAALFYAFLQTGLSEEILFRGLIGRKLVTPLGWWPANVIQSLAFAGAHMGLALLAETKFEPQFYLTLCLFPFFYGLLFAMMNRRTGKDTILASVVAHGLGNFAAFCFGFL